jgi:arylamine N-acetyltransferase
MLHFSLGIVRTAAHGTIRRHVVNIVTLSDGSRYSTDVGFGGDGPIKPLPLVDGHITPNLGSQEVRLSHEVIPDFLTEPQKLWVYQYRNGTDRPWNSFYTFSETEWLPADFDVVNTWASTNPGSFQTTTMLIVRFLRRESQIHGKAMLVNGDVKQNLGGKTSLLMSCQTEEERVEALRSVFGITLTDEQREGIKGRATELSRLPN